ncbi:MAG: CAP domain-containing protein, partial [Planctomycetota bacterium]
VRDRDADFATRLETRAAESELLAAWHDAVAAALRAGLRFKVVLATGPADITGCEGAMLVADQGGGRWSWYDLGGKAVLAIANQLAVAGQPALGAAVLLFKSGESTAAEALLARALRADATIKEGVDRVLARGRGEVFDPRGYALGKDGFQSVRSLEVQKQATQLASRLDAALRDKDPKARQALLDETLAAGPDAVLVLAAALQRDLTRQLQKLDTGALRKQVDKLAAQRQLLDVARQHAKDLIYDEKKYFYPYKPPAVSSDRYAEYVRVQAEVDRRVAAVRTLWNDDRIKVRVPASLRADLDRLDWLAKGLAGLGELDHAQLAPLEWARALPASETVTVRDYCAAAAERAEFDEWRHVEAYNKVVGQGVSSAQRELLKVTNDYRAMFRHRPLAIVVTVCTAAQGHAEEMAKLGYFAHMSPTPGRETPYDRMKLAGYTFGVSENIALVDGAQGAHNAWCQSSGHHRNLLAASHREMGIGADGRYWVENFGSGTVHRDDAAWASTGSSR